MPSNKGGEQREVDVRRWSPDGGEQRGVDGDGDVVDAQTDVGSDVIVEQTDGDVVEAQTGADSDVVRACDVVDVVRSDDAVDVVRADDVVDVAVVVDPLWIGGVDLSEDRIMDALSPLSKHTKL